MAKKKPKQSATPEQPLASVLLRMPQDWKVRLTEVAAEVGNNAFLLDAIRPALEGRGVKLSEPRRQGRPKGGE